MPPALQEPARVERRLLATRRVAVGEWRLAREHPQFEDTGPTRQCVIAFPRTAVAIAHEGQREFVADAGLATVYNHGQHYRRRAIDPAGDRCDWFGVDTSWALEASLAAGMRPADASRPFCVAHAPVSAAVYLRQRALLQRVREGAVDGLEVEEHVLALVAAVCRAGIAATPRPLVATRLHQRLAADARALLALSLREQVGLDALAQRLGVSVFHLCRVFRTQTGASVHRHLAGLRLRAALEPLAEAAADLTAIALDHGFASHSHFSAAFRREFGCTPSAWREAVRRGSRSRPQRPAAALPRRR